MTKIVVNRCWGGYSLSADAAIKLAKLKGLVLNKKAGKYGDFDLVDENGEDHYEYQRYEERSDPDLIKIVEEMGDEASGTFASLEIVEVPDDVQWVIEDYDGMETVEERHRSW